MKATIIIPTYNEKDNIETLIAQIDEVIAKIKNHKLTILVVDDESPDGTGEIVKKLQKKYKYIYLITGKKEGWGRAYLRGMAYASKELAADVMFEMDADFSHDPKEIPNFLKKIDEGFDMVVGSRYIKGGSIPANWGLHRIIFSVMGNLLVRVALLNFGHKEWTGGYRAIRTSIYKKVYRELEDFKGYTFQVSFLHKAFQNGAKIAEIPIQFKDRVFGESKISSEYIINLVSYLIKTNIQNPPRQLRFMIVGGSSFLIQSLLFAIFKEFIRAELANAIGFTTAVTNNFLLNNFWTFHDRKKRFAPRLILSYGKFYAFSLLSLSLQTITIFLSQHTIGYNDLGEWVGFICGVTIGLFINYLVYSRIIWRKHT